MKNFLIRVQIIAIILVFLSPLLYLVVKHFRPQLELIKYDRARQQTEKTYPALSWLRTNGKYIVDDQNQPVILRGVNIASTTWGPEYETWNPQAVEKVIKDWHANVIRTRVHQYEFEDNPATFFLKLEKQILEPARRNGVYVILHPWFGENESLPNHRGQAMWLALAKRYRDDPHILFDLFAEPRDLTHQQLAQAYTDIIPQLRQVHPRSLIFVTGLDWGREINSWLDTPLPYDNLVYRTNPYNRDGEFAGYFGKIAQEKPVFIGEFGTEPKLTMNPGDVTKLLGYADSLELGWTAWHFSSSGCPCLLSDNSSFTPSDYGQIVKNALAGRKYSYSLPIFDPDNSKYYLYSDFLENGFSDYSWLTKTNLLDTSDHFAGNNSFRGTLTAGGGIYFHSSRITNPHQYISFNFAIKTITTNSLMLRFRNAKDEFSNPIMIKDYVKSSPEWVNVSIPTDQISLSEVVGVTLEPEVKLTAPTDIFLDQVYFSK